MRPRNTYRAARRNKGRNEKALARKKERIRWGLSRREYDTFMEMRRRSPQW